MEMKPKEVIETLNCQDKVLFKEILNKEKEMLHHEKISGRIEKGIVDDIIKLINKAVPDED